MIYSLKIPTIHGKKNNRRSRSQSSHQAIQKRIRPHLRLHTKHTARDRGRLPRPRRLHPHHRMGPLRQSPIRRRRGISRRRQNRRQHRIHRADSRQRAQRLHHRAMDNERKHLGRINRHILRIHQSQSARSTHCQQTDRRRLHPLPITLSRRKWTSHRLPGTLRQSHGHKRKHPRAMGPVRIRSRRQRIQDNHIRQALRRIRAHGRNPFSRTNFPQP